MRPQISIGNDLPISITLPTPDDVEKKWVGWRVWAVDLHRDADRKLRLNVFADPIDGPKQQEVFEFFLGPLGQTASPRFTALAVACGIRTRLTSVDQLEGRYFATRNGGKLSIDFGSLEFALAPA
ncbi:hypothetical protein GAO09_04570 [Rhizobiales bacterium RZME27]|uniref:Uncharacterized protein n=1 Tax=Endobacterium cereale TaxID=2663029 RepID=A0A6A8A3J2_9HYPH|nr:hypothetical protein [Endobacterium cereale]MQY45339.1 hypothetical protein [Endobacterium cereale]